MLESVWSVTQVAFGVTDSEVGVVGIWVYCLQSERYVGVNQQTDRLVA